MTIHRKCDDCGNDYEAQGDWQTICKRCYHLAKVKEGQQQKQQSNGFDDSPALDRIADAIFALAKAVEGKP